MLIKSIICLTEEAEKEDPELDLMINAKLNGKSAKLNNENSSESKENDCEKDSENNGLKETLDPYEKDKHETVREKTDGEKEKEI